MTLGKIALENFVRKEGNAGKHYFLIFQTVFYPSKDEFELSRLPSANALNTGTAKILLYDND